MKTVISQSMYFPWVGLLEQINLADTFIHYDDIQFARGFLNRVQIKTADGIRWLTIPLRDRHQGQRIDELVADERQDWRAEHRRMLLGAYRGSRFLEDMLEVFDRVAAEPSDRLPDITRASMLALADYFGVDSDCRFLDSTGLVTTGRSSERLLELCKAVAADVYVTGHGARNYLDYSIFEAVGIEVEYMDYRCLPYRQLHGPFTPFVSALDLIANCGPAGRDHICSGSKPWKEFLHGPE